MEKAWGRDAEVYRCEHCKTLYLPNPEESGGLNVAGSGQISVFGLTVPPKTSRSRVKGINHRGHEGTQRAAA